MKRILWMLLFLVPATAMGTVVSFTATNDTVCANNCITYTNTTAGLVDSVKWAISGMSVPDSASSSITVCFPLAGLYTVKLFVYHGGNVDSGSRVTTIMPLPHPQLIDTPCCSVTGAYMNFQWYQNFAPIPGATDNNYAGGVGCWFVQVDSAGCYSVSNSYCDTVGAGVSQVCVLTGKVTVAPNPANSVIYVYSTGKINTVSIVSVLGDNVFRQNCDTDKLQIDVAALPPGIYLLSVNGMAPAKFLKE